MSKFKPYVDRRQSAERGPPHVATNRSAIEQLLPNELTASNRPSAVLRRADTIDCDAGFPVGLARLPNWMGQPIAALFSDVVLSDLSTSLSTRAGRCSF
jgi:hypothetical protein